MRKTSKWKTGKRPRSEPLAKAPLGAKLNFSGFLTRKKIIVEASPVGVSTEKISPNFWFGLRRPAGRNTDPAAIFTPSLMVRYAWGSAR